MSPPRPSVEKEDFFMTNTITATAYGFLTRWLSDAGDVILWVSISYGWRIRFPEGVSQIIFCVWLVFTT